MKSVRIGLDIGGTKLLGIVADHQGNILDSEKINVNPLKSSNDLSELFESMVQKIRKDYFVESVGISVPGPVSKDGYISTLVNLNLKDVHIKPQLEKQLNLPVNIGNDVNCATLAEYKFGAGKDTDSLFTLYPGTGLGGGYIQDGQLVIGKNGTAGEVGHMVIDVNGEKCNCGNRGCLETFVSNLAFRRMLRSKGIEDLVNEFPGINLSYGELTEKAWNEKHPVIREVILDQAKMLGIGIANIINLVGVDRILIGGNLYHRLGRDLLDVVRANAEEYALGAGLDGVEIKLTSLGAEAPALGTTLL